ncbi:alpha/beta hydrolase fold protein [Gymnopus androsaceus JB14]|uniref:Alpha/beta hydrolase fold protein n=1 Tax=Gymnopus androsaceus JB14 TaxID=1447944 RepID=A0A6A4HB20_9AGAR|nr:alpha/beta hydrolase fold protein [Gymnopus androsaceus JB14]
MSATQFEVFYREAGKKDASVVLLLHGFPTSSFQYRNLITKLAGDYRVIAPDYPGFGFTKVPETRNYEYTFDNLAKTIEAFVDALSLKKYAMYIFDYGAPVGLRLARSRPSAITAIVSQNGNAFREGFGDRWKPIFRYWEEPTLANRQAIGYVTTFNAKKNQRIPPETYHLDQALMDRAGNVDIQLDLFLNYRTNVAAYPSFQEYLREHQPPLLAIWGKNDISFIPREPRHSKLHFPLENHLDEIASEMIAFLKRNGV